MAVAAVCDAISDDTGLIAAIMIGIALANLPAVDVPEDRPMLKTVLQLTIGLLFISISATVTPRVGPQRDLADARAGCRSGAGGSASRHRPVDHGERP